MPSSLRRQIGDEAFCVHHLVFDISHRLRPRALEVPPWWSSISPPAMALPHHTSSTNLCALLSPSIALPKPIEKRPHPFRTPCCIVSESTSLLLSPHILFQWRCSPFLRTIAEAVVTIGSQFSEYEFNVIVAPSFPGADVSEEMESSPVQGRASSP